MRPAIRVENLSKCYRVNDKKRTGQNLSETIATTARTAWDKVRQLTNPNATQVGTHEFWALKDVSFEVKPGEVVGIIGRNGAGKSTLLKILSQIVEPSSGYAEIDGRVNSLLEVGTGFHPELTGRENVYLNATILGMNRKEIAKKFDEIVDFSGVEEFLDTPVKRYSSGMMVRLGFAVAAHLNPDVLIVDEVLAVGDSDFQSKCIKAMNQVRQDGTTVIVVSHNLTTVRTLCQSGIVLDRGKVMTQSTIENAVNYYLSMTESKVETPIADRTDREGNGEAVITDLWLGMTSSTRADHFYCGFDALINMKYRSHIKGKKLEAAISVWNNEGQKLFHVDTSQRNNEQYITTPHDTIQCHIPRLPLPEGEYTLNAMLLVDGKVADHVYGATRFNVLPGDFYGVGKPSPAGGGTVFVDHNWSRVC